MLGVPGFYIPVEFYFTEMLEAALSGKLEASSPTGEAHFIFGSRTSSTGSIHVSCSSASSTHNTGWNGGG